MTKNSLKLMSHAKAEIEETQITPSRMKHTHRGTSFTNFWKQIAKKNLFFSCVALIGLVYFTSKGENTVIDMMHSPRSESKEFRGLLWVHHSEKELKQIWMCKGGISGKYEFLKITQPGHKHGPLTLLRALSPPLFRYSALKTDI